MEQATEHAKQAAEHGFSLFPALPLPGLTPHQALIVENTWISMIIIIAVAFSVCISMKKIPGGLQNFVEFLVAFIENQIADIVGKKGLKYFPLVITVFMFILVANYIGLIPGFLSPTSSLSTTAAWAIVVFVFYQYIGISRGGFKYLKHFCGPIFIGPIPIMLPIEIISEFARPFSLSVRLFANIFAGEMIVKLLFSFVALGAPVIWMLVDGGFVMFIQAFIFSLLTMVYLAGAVAADEGH
jgi:F-type H+-transporting ATPase subunit a